MTRFNIGGVPEHYNLPFYLLHEEQPLKTSGLEVHWSTYSTGTGAMLKDLRSGKLDIAILLTEGIVTDQHAGNTAQIVAQYVASPLVWGVHTHVNHAWDISKGVTPETRFAISRKKSGSHLMAYLYAQRFGVSLSDGQFVIVNNMPGAAEAMSQGEADLFLWEKFTTKPMVDQGVFQRVDAIPTPWAPFMIVARKEVVEEKRMELALLIAWLQKRTALLTHQHDSTIETIAERFGQKPDDVAQWFQALQWDVAPIHGFTALEKVEQTLIDLQIIEPSGVFV